MQFDNQYQLRSRQRGLYIHSLEVR